MANANDWICWEHIEGHLHDKVMNGPESYNNYGRWLDLADVCEEHLGWLYDGSCDLTSCETWDDIYKTLAKHVGKEWNWEWCAGKDF